MRFANLDGRAALACGGGYLDLARASEGRWGPDPMAALEQWPAVVAWASGRDLTREPSPEETASGALLAPVPRPRQVFGIGLNYRDHVAEAGTTVPDTPAVFTKFPTSITGPQTPVRLPAGSVDWEVELVVVIGARAEGVPETAAWDHVAGVTVGQDLSERQLQLAGPVPQFSLGKSHPGFAPIGPELVTVDELTDRDDLALGCALEGGEVLQDGRTRDLVFSVPQLIARLSAVLPLLPGDLVFTGTPNGVGMARQPAKFLQPGDVLVSWVEGVGRMRTPMTAGATSPVSAASAPGTSGHP